MSYRWQDTMKILIPGFYILSCVGVGYWRFHNHIDDNLVEGLGKLSAILIVCMLWVAFIIGYLNEIVSGEIEILLYRIGWPRPSRLILNGSLKRFSIVRNVDLKSQLNILQTEFVDNLNAAKCLEYAKQSTETDKYQEFYYQSVLARDLFFGHIFSSILLVIMAGWSWIWFSIEFLIAVLFWVQWWKMNLVYVKKIFVEFLKE